MIYIITYIVIFCIQATLAYGMIFANQQAYASELAEEFYDHDRKAAIKLGLMAGIYPILGLIVCITVEEPWKHGLKFK